MKLSEHLSEQLRPAVHQDLSQVIEIEKRCHRTPWKEDNFETELAKSYSHFLVLQDASEKIIGYVVFWYLFDECQILNIAVEPSQRGKGFGTRMIHRVAQLAQAYGLPCLTLEVRKSNEAAIQLYQKVGFHILSVRKRFYSDGEDAYHMNLALG